MASRKITVQILGDASGLKRALGAANKDVAKFGSGVGTMGVQAKRGFGSAVGGAVRLAATTTGLLGVAAALGKIGTATVGFDAAMRNVNSLAGLSERKFQLLEKSVLKLAGKTAQAPQTLADGLYDLVSSGFKSADALKILEASAKAATAGLTTTEVSTKAVAAVLNAYHRPAKDAAAISDALFQTVNLGVVTFDQLANTIGDVLPFASSLGVNIEQVGSSMATMTKAGLSAEESATRIKNVMVAMIKPGDALAVAIKRTGFESGEALVKSKGYQGALEALVGTTDGTKGAVAQLFPNIRALGGALALTGRNTKAAESDLRAFGNTSGATDKVLREQSKSVSYQWNEIKATFAALAITMGSVLIPAVAKTMAAVSGFVKQMQAGAGAGGKFRSALTAVSRVLKSHEKELRAVGDAVDAVFRRILIPAFGLLRAAASRALPGISKQFRGMAQVIGGVANVVSGIIHGDFGKAFGGMRSIVSGTVKSVLGKFRAMTAPLREIGARLGQAIIRPLHDLGARFVELGRNLILGLVKGIKGAAQSAVDAAKGVADGAISGVKGVLGIKSPSRVFMTLGEFIAKGLAIGIGNGASGVAMAARKGLLFPLEAAISELEAKRDRLQAAFDRNDSKAERRSLVRDVRTAKRGTWSGGSGAGDAGSGGGSGVIGGGKFLQGLGAQVGESKYFGGVTTNRHKRYANDHYSGNSIDVNYAGGGAGELGKLKGALAKLRARFGKSIQQALIEDVGKANQHLHVTFKSAGAAAAAVAGKVKGAAAKMAAKATGKLTPNQMRGLLYAQGFRGRDLDVAVAIGMAESGGKVRAQNRNSNGSVDRGFMQINSVHGKLSTFDPTGNARSAKALYDRRGGFKDWATYNSGAYKRFMGDTGSGKGSATGGAGGTWKAGDIAGATKALKDFDRAAARTRKLAAIDVKVAGLEKLAAWRDALDGIKTALADNLTTAVETFGETWDKTIGKGIDEANRAALQSFDDLAAGASESLAAIHSAALDAFDLGTEAAVANGPAARALRALEDEAARIQAAAETASQAQALEDARRSGDPRAIAAAQAAIDETARQRAISAAQTAAETERKGIQAARAAERKAIERAQADETQALDRETAAKRAALEEQQAADRLARYTTDSDAFKAKLKGDLDAEYATLVARGQNYASFVNKVNSILAQVGNGSTGNQYAPDASAEAAVNARGPGLVFTAVPARKTGIPKGKHGGRRRGKRASGGPLVPGVAYTVGELGRETVMATPSGGLSVVPSSAPAMAAAPGGRGDFVGIQVQDGGTVVIGNQRAAMAMANRLAYRATFG